MRLLPTGEQHVLRPGDAEAVVVEVGGGPRTYRAGGRDVVDGYGEREMAANAPGTSWCRGPTGCGTAPTPGAARSTAPR